MTSKSKRFCALLICGLFVLTLPLYVLHIRGVWQRSGRDLDPMLPLLVLSTFAFALLGGLGFLVYLW